VKVSLRVLSECTYQMYCGQRIPLIEVMNCIEQVFVDFNLVKGLKKNRIKKFIVNDQVSTRM
jgi:hypothetical protein